MRTTDLLPQGMNPEQYAEYLRKLAGHYAGLAQPLLYHLYQAAALIEDLYGVKVKRPPRPDLRDAFDKGKATPHDIEQLLGGPPGAVRHPAVNPGFVGQVPYLIDPFGGGHVPKGEGPKGPPPNTGSGVQPPKKARTILKEAPPKKPTGGFFG